MLLARFSISEPFKLVITHWLALAAWQRCRTITEKGSGHETEDGENLGCHRVIVF